MAWHRLLLVVLSAVLVSGVASTNSAIAAPTAGCNTAGALNGGCSVTGNIHGGGVNLTGQKNIPGSGGGISHPSGPRAPKPPAPVCQGLPAACQKFIVIPPASPATPAVTITDLKNFPASPGTDHMEPPGWMIVGLDTNFYSQVGVQVVEGILLGQPASVRFTPVSWRWAYGDGTSAVRATPGATWAAQGIPEFDPTATSHVYTSAGTYFIDLSITFLADYRFAGGNWTRVTGTLTLPANRLEATAGGAKTVLVNRDCAQNPSGPGC